MAGKIGNVSLGAGRNKQSWLWWPTSNIAVDQKFPDVGGGWNPPWDLARFDIAIFFLLGDRAKNAYIIRVTLVDTSCCPGVGILRLIFRKNTAGIGIQ